MNISNRDSVRPTGRREQKRDALIDGALTVFARDGYARASIDQIAQEAQVSTRTLYNHFGSKTGLFEAVIHESASRVAHAQIALIEQFLGSVRNLEADLIAFGKAIAAPETQFAEHFALVWQIKAEVGHIPQTAIDAWQEAGPRRVRCALADHLNRLRGSQVLDFDEPEWAALHLMLLVTASSTLHAAGRKPQDVEKAVVAGVRVFLKAYSRQPNQEAS